jgi:hypothetical protein
VLGRGDELLRHARCSGAARPRAPCPCLLIIINRHAT